MRISLGVTLQVQNAAGLEIWALEFIKALANIDKENEYLIFDYFWRNFQQRQKAFFLPEQNNFSLYLKKAPKPIITYFEDRKISIIERWLKKKNIDIFHSTGYFLPYLKKIKAITTIHGLDFKEMDAYWYEEVWYKNIPLYLKRADSIIAVSEYVKTSLMRYYKIPQEKICVIYPGVREGFVRIEDKTKLDAFRKHLKIFPPYIFTVATSVERKNLKRILESYRRVKKLHSNLKLVIAGNKKSIQMPLVKEIEKMGLINDVYFPGYLNATELVYFYNLAEAFIFPSLYEGFGLPVLEAMVCGCPVITSNITAMPEIAGGAAILVNPYSVEEISAAINRILADENIQQDMMEKGLQRAKFFSWEKTINNTIHLYNKLMDKS